MAGLSAFASHGSSLHLAANSGSSWMSQTPNLHFSDAVVKNDLVKKEIAEFIS